MELNSAVGAAKQAKTFWKVVSEVSMQEIQQETEREFRLALVGPPEQTVPAFRALIGPDATEAEVIAARERVASFPEPPEASVYAKSGPPLAVIFADGVRRELSFEAPTFLLEGQDDMRRVIGAILEANEEYALALGRVLPGVRPLVAERLVQTVSMVNAQVAVVSAVPLASLLLPATALTNLVIMTKNQAMLVLRISAAYGRSLDLRERARELGPVVGSAFGWRAAARHLGAMVPGVGFAVNAAIAYAGTQSVGRAAAWYFETGETLNAEKMRELYAESLRNFRSRLDDLRRRRGRDAIEDAEPDDEKKVVDD